MFRFYQGKNKLTQVALGKSEEAEYKDGIHKISEQLVGEVGLLFTNRNASEVEQYFNKYNRASFARSNGKFYLKFFFAEVECRTFEIKSKITS